MKIDSDLQIIQEVRNLVANSRAAQEAYKLFSQPEVDKLVAAIAEAGFNASEKLAHQAVRETGYGNIPDKIKKNQFATRDIYESIRDLRTVGVIEEDSKTKVLKIAEPMGVVAAIIPTTNPTSTAMFKILISLKTRNAIVLSPHPRAAGCITMAANILADAARKAGAPDGLINVIPTPSLPATQELMHNQGVDVILATGGTAMVRAAYSAGKPAYGVGPGNVPAYVDRSADYRKAIPDLIAGKTFDYGTLCSSEQAIIVDAPLHQRVKELMRQQGAYFMNADESSKLQKTLITEKYLINANMVGKSPQVLAKFAGFQIPENTKLLAAELGGVGKEYPLSAEKLSPVLSYYVVNGWEEGIRRSVEILNFGGMGHTAAIHCKDDEVIRAFGLAVPASRVVVNSPSSVGAVGYTNGLLPSLTLGCGSWGRNITSDNISARHLMNIKRIAYETKPFAQPRNGATWKAGVHHHHQDKEAPYTKALSADVSRKGSAGKSQGAAVKPEVTPSADSGSFGESGMSATEVDRVIGEFLKTRN